MLPPQDDGRATHLGGLLLPRLGMPSTDGKTIYLDDAGLSVVYAYPKTSPPDGNALDGWDAIPGARGCTPQSCAFRDHFSELRQLGVDRLFGLSTQTTEYQQEAVERLHLPFPLLSDKDLRLSTILNLPTFEVEGQVLLKRLTLIIRDGRVEHVFYPVFPPDQNADDVINWLKTAA